MPRQVDHKERRQRIAEAVWRIAADRGLESVSMREIAGEAGTSIGQIQHYFTNKDELLLFATTHLREQIDQHVRDRIAAAHPSTSTELLRATLAGLLPLDAEARTGALVGIAVFIKSLSDPELAAKYREGHDLIVATLTQQLTSAVRAGELRPDLPAEQEAHLLAALVSGLASGILLGHYSPEDALTLLDHQIGRLK